jgi:FKBP-type peptidyl-prolyl cis-trans isomerase SlyD
MSLEKGSLIFANYTAKVKDTGETIETTLEEEAKKLQIYDATRRYGPRLIAVGEGWLISGLDEAVEKMDVGQRKEIELSPEKAFGKRDPTQTRMIPLRKFGEKADELAVGDTIEVENRVGIVRFVGSGRAQVDFNHRLAGKSIVYDFEVLKRVETEEEKIRALIDRRFVNDGGKVTFARKNEGLEVEIPEELFLTEGLQIIKRGISADLFKFVPTIRNMNFVERFVNKNPEPKPAEKPKEKTTEPIPKPEIQKRTRAKKRQAISKTV